MTGKPAKPWAVELLDEAIETELARLPDDMRARFIKISELIETHGLPSVGKPHVEHVRGKLWEMQLKGKSGIARGLYVAAHARRVVVLRVFVKKTQKTPKSEIDLALDRARQVKDG